MKRTKLFLTITTGLATASLFSLAACSKQEPKSEISKITFVVEGKGEVSANTLEVRTGSKWVEVEHKPTLTPYKYWKSAGLFINGIEVKDETVIDKDYTMTVKFVHDETQSKVIHFEVVTEEGSVEPTKTYWKGYTFGQLKEDGLLPVPQPIGFYVFADGWYKDQNCQYKISDDTPIEELDYVYVDFILDPEVYAHIDFELSTRYGQILEGGSIDVQKGTKWANVPHPIIQPANGYVVDQYLVNGSLILTDDYVFENSDTITITFKECTPQSKFKFELNANDDYAVLTSYVETGDKDIIVPSYYYNNNKAYPIKQIGKTQLGVYPVFDDATIQSVAIPEGVEIIDTQIFSANCTNVASVSFPDSITTFNGAIFAGKNTNIGSLHFGKNVTTLYSSVIDNLPNLGNIVINEFNQTYYDGRTKGGSNCVIKVSDKSFVCGCTSSVLPNDLITIGSNAFKGLLIQQINIPASVRTIGLNAFEGTPLKSVDFAQRATGDTLEIFSYAFKGCTDLKSVSLPNTTTKINDYAFQNSGLESFRLPRDVTRSSMSTMVSGAIVAGCNNLTSITVDKDNPHYESIDDCNIIIDKDVTTSQIRMGCKTSKFPEGTKVSQVAGSAFRNCSIPEIIIPEGYTRLFANAFYDCSKATKVKLPLSMKATSSIGSTAFFGCTNVNRLDLTSYVGLTVDEISNVWTKSTSTTQLFWFANKGQVIVANGTSDEAKQAWEAKLKNCGITLFDQENWEIVEAE